MLNVMSLVLTGAEVKKSADKVPVTVDFRIDITKMAKKSADMVVMDFDYIVDYKPKIARVKMSGYVECADTPANIKKVLNEFKKKKKLPVDLTSNALNMINADVGLNTIFLIRPFNLLPHFMPPRIIGPAEKKKRR